MDNVQRIFRNTDDILARLSCATINLEHLLKRGRIFIVIFVQNGFFVLCFYQFALFAHTCVIVIKHNRTVLLYRQCRSVLQSGFVWCDRSLLHYKKSKTE